MTRTSWHSQQQGQIRLGDERVPNALKRKNSGVPKAAMEEGILQLLASAAEMQQRQDLDSALQLYQAAMEKVKDHGLNRKTLFNGTNKKPPPLNSRTPLEWSLHVGDIASAICLLKGPNTALAKLRTQVSYERVVQILDAGAEVEFRIGPVGRTLLLQESAEGRHAGVRLALDRGANVACMDDNGDTALALALRCDQPQSKSIVADLLEAQADLNAYDGQHQPLFKVAMAYSRPEVVAQVIDVLSPLTEEHRQHMQDWAAILPEDGNQWSIRTVEVVRLLLGHGLDPNTPCHPTRPSTLLEKVMRRRVDDSDLLIEALLGSGAEPKLEAALQSATPRALSLILNKLTLRGEPQPQRMVEWVKRLSNQPKKWDDRDVEVLKLLLDIGLDPSLRRAVAPHSPLIVCAVTRGDLSLVQRLIDRGAQLNAADDNSDTALICAAKTTNRGIYDALKAAGVNDKYFLGWSVWSNYSHG
ncbi:hypothetical protein MMC28_003892 [Mycoblastus sanguinarius]|nr:hypothetical protein [Mycoblastus sanguinarius]